jgi:hypothetical protein
MFGARAGKRRQRQGHSAVTVTELCQKNQKEREKEKGEKNGAEGKTCGRCICPLSVPGQQTTESHYIQLGYPPGIPGNLFVV